MNSKFSVGLPGERSWNLRVKAMLGRAEVVEWTGLIGKSPADVTECVGTIPLRSLGWKSVKSV